MGTFFSEFNFSNIIDLYTINLLKKLNSIFLGERFSLKIGSKGLSYKAILKILNCNSLRTCAVLGNRALEDADRLSELDEAVLELVTGVPICSIKERKQ